MPGVPEVPGMPGMLEVSVRDVSHLFWQFVSDVITLSYSKLSRTPAFKALSTGGEFAVSFSTLGLVDTPCNHCTDMPGIYQDDFNRVFVFSDVTSLLSNTPHIVCDSSQRALLNECLRKINNFVEMHDLADDLEREQFAD